MKKIFALVALAFGCLGGQAIAAPVTIEYKMQVSNIKENSFQVESSDDHGFDISVGETVTGYFTYDTTQLMYTDGPNGFLLWENFSLAFQFENNPELVTLDQDLRLETWEGSELRIGGYAYGAPDSSSAGSRAYFIFVDDPYRPLNGYLPAPDQWTGFLPDSNITYVYNSTQGYLIASGNVTSFRVVSSVPEPEAYLMWMTGASLLLFAGRSRRRQSS